MYTSWVGLCTLIPRSAHTGAHLIMPCTSNTQYTVLKLHFCAVPRLGLTHCHSLLTHHSQAAAEHHVQLGMAEVGFQTFRGIVHIMERPAANDILLGRAWVGCPTVRDLANNNYILLIIDLIYKLNWPVGLLTILLIRHCLVGYDVLQLPGHSVYNVTDVGPHPRHCMCCSCLAMLCTISWTV